MPVLASILSGVGGLISLVCFILVLVKMFQNGKTGLGIACIVLFFCCGIGGLVAYIYGWVGSGDWDLRNVMLAWTVGIILGIVGGALNPGQFQQFQQIQVEQQPIR
jgi:hypothetical protein